MRSPWPSTYTHVYVVHTLPSRYARAHNHHRDVQYDVISLYVLLSLSRSHEHHSFSNLILICFCLRSVTQARLKCLSMLEFGVTTSANDRLHRNIGYHRTYIAHIRWRQITVWYCCWYWHSIYLAGFISRNYRCFRCTIYEHDCVQWASQSLRNFSSQQIQLTNIVHEHRFGITQSGIVDRRTLLRITRLFDCPPQFIQFNAQMKTHEHTQNK